MTDTPLPGDDDAPMTMAAEFALGLLDGEERATAMRRMLAEPGFAAEVERWRDHFGLLFDAWPEAAAPAGGVARIEAALTPRPVATNDNRAVRRWQGVAALTSAAAAALLGVMVFGPSLVPPPTVGPVVKVTPDPVLIAAITPSEKGAPVAALYEPRSGALRIGAAALADASHSAELWVISATDKTPHSLGVLRPGAETQLALRDADRQRLVAGATLAVTIEVPGGSPTGKPQGPLVAAGSLVGI